MTRLAEQAPAPTLTKQVGDGALSVGTVSVAIDVGVADEVCRPRRAGVLDGLKVARQTFERLPDNLGVIYGVALKSFGDGRRASRGAADHIDEVIGVLGLAAVLKGE